MALVIFAQALWQVWVHMSHLSHVKIPSQVLYFLVQLAAEAVVVAVKR